MDPRLLQYYNHELQHLREMGAEFAQQFPKIAARLGMSGLEVSDPYVERLLEGVAFMAARVQLKLDSEFPRFTQALLETVYPHYLAPTPSMLVTQFRPDPGDTNLAEGSTIPRGSVLHGIVGADDNTATEFRTAHDVRLWPVDVVSASYFSFAPDLPLSSLSLPQREKGGVRIRLRTTAGLTFSRTSIDRLCFYLAGPDEVANKLYELCISAPVGALVLSPGRPGARYHFLPATAIHPVGFGDDQALLPVTLRSFQGYRLLQEYFSFPERYRFFELTGLAGAIAASEGDELELVMLFGRGHPALESVVDASNLALFCTPAINLFPKRTDRVAVSDGGFEYHVVPDRTRPLDFEVYQISEVTGYGTGASSERDFQPFYAAYTTDQSHRDSAYYTVRREPRLVTAEQKRRGTRTSYVGSEMFISLVDADQAPFSGDLRQLSVTALCTNRDLVLQMPLGLGSTDFTLDVAAPISSIRVVSGPSRPQPPVADRSVSWRAISHLSLNYLSLVNSTPQEGATALRELLELYGVAADAARRQIEGVKSVHARPVVRRVPTPGPIAFGRGVEIAVEVEDLAFEGSSAFLFGSVLDQFFARHVSINSFTQTALRSSARGEIHRWMPRWGAKPTL